MAEMVSTRPLVFRLADWLCLAAAPTFGVMALATAAAGDQSYALCSAMHEASPLTGMGTMYLLMSVFHAPPWLRLVSRLRNEKRRA